ncbi:hypothetical protein K435DRAFT_805172 [Dendrothele bispora CBS 962.96]|uniref:Uncharacterized protein n=1 Tax=Dendrothele bispora (strain CBS 962.96) TaxID=1314807 RepID=A0A4S8LC03_DENBC|nr:hypothetical protein K435DRAFT_805172 [Dendrothele bispora CBS 962.96]
MSLDYTDLDANNPDTAILTPGESPQALVPGDSDKHSARNRPQSAVSSNKKEEPRDTFISAPPGPSASAQAGPPDSARAGPSAQESNDRSNTPPSDNENADDQEQVDDPKEFIQTTRQQQSRRHPLLGHRQTPVTGNLKSFQN